MAVAAPQAAATGASLVPFQPAWTKVCFNDPQTSKATCYTTRDFADESQTPIVSVQVFEVKGESQRLLRVMLPLGARLKPGFRFQVDQGKPETGGAFEICFPAGCYGEAKVSPAFIESMRKGEKLIIFVKNATGAEINFAAPLGGFGQALDGPSMDLKAAEEREGRLREELKMKAEEAARTEPKKEATSPSTPPSQ